MLDSSKYSLIFFVDFLAMFAICAACVIVAGNPSEELFALLFYLTTIIVQLCKWGVQRQILHKMVMDERAWAKRELL